MNPNYKKYDKIINALLLGKAWIAITKKYCCSNQTIVRAIRRDYKYNHILPLGLANRKILINILISKINLF